MPVLPPETVDSSSLQRVAQLSQFQLRRLMLMDSWGYTFSRMILSRICISLVSWLPCFDNLKLDRSAIGLLVGKEIHI